MKTKIYNQKMIYYKFKSKVNLAFFKAKQFQKKIHKTVYLKLKKKKSLKSINYKNLNFKVKFKH